MCAIAVVMLLMVMVSESAYDNGFTEAITISCDTAK